MFEFYKEIPDGTGFTIEKTGDLIYPYDKFYGWYDEYQNYYLYENGKIKSADRPFYEFKDDWKKYQPYWTNRNFEVDDEEIDDCEYNENYSDHYEEAI